MFQNRLCDKCIDVLTEPQNKKAGVGKPTPATEIAIQGNYFFEKLNIVIKSSRAGELVGTYGLSGEAIGLGKLSRLRAVTVGRAQFASMNFRIETWSE